MIDTKAIRAKVLDLAIRGELTKQLPEDGTAEQLYRRIQADKQSFIKDTKSKPLPSVEKSEMLFDAPMNWVWVRFASITINHDGKRKPVTKSDRVSVYGTYEYFGATGAIDRVDDYLFDGDYLMIGEDGGNFFTDRPNSFIATGKFWANNHVHVIQPVLISIWYLKYVIDSYNLPKMGLIRGLAAPKLNQANLNSIPIPLPPLPEQHRIVAKIDAIFSLLDTIDALQSAYTANQKALRAKLIDAAIRGQLTEQLPEDGTAEELYRQIQQEKSNILLERGGRDDKSIRPINGEIPYDLPVTWKWIRFGDIGLFRKGPFGSALTKSMFVPKSEATIKVYEQQHAINKNKNLGTYYITAEYFDEKMKGFEVRPGDVIISCAGTIGETYILPDDIERGIINQALMRVTIVPSIDKKFFQYFFDARLKRNAQNESNGSAINNIPPFEVLKNWYFPLPPLAEQKRIVAKLEQLLLLCEE